MQKCRKTNVCGTRGKPPCKNRTFAFCVSLIVQKWKTFKKNMRTTIIDVKLDEKSKSELRIGLPCKENPENAENCRKIIKLLVEKNHVNNYLVHQ